MDAPPAAPDPACPGCRALQHAYALLERRLLELEGQIRDLQDRLQPPTPKPHEPQPPAPAKTPTGRKRGAQPGHPPKLKTWLPPDRVQRVVHHTPTCCTNCDTPLSLEPGPNDPPPTIWQVADLPTVRAEIVEHQGHFRTCACGHLNHTPVPEAVRAHSIGPGLAAAIGIFAGSHGVSKRGIEEIVEHLFDVPVALGTITNLEREMTDALEPAYQEARQHVADAPVKNLDETGWKQGKFKRWLWAGATATAVVFLIHTRRNLDALKLLLGRLSGTIISDRWRVYDHWDYESRQICWAHVKRNWDRQVERGGRAKELGERWQSTQREVFELWHHFRGGGMSRRELGDRVLPLVERLGELLHEGIDAGDAKLSGFCTRLLDRFPLLWLFTVVEGVEPTNNHAERVQRRAVLWRRRSFGCQSAGGCRYVERILTVVQTLRLQKRNALSFVTQTLAAHRRGSPRPKLC